MVNEEGEVGAAIPPFVSDPLGAAARRWKAMAAVFTLGVVATAIAAAVWPKTYSAATTIAMSGSPLTQQYVALTQSPEMAPQVNALIEEALSRESLAALIERHRLYTERRAKVGMLQMVQLARTNIEFADVPSLSRDPRSSAVFRLSFSYGDPKIAADFVNDLASSVVAINSRTRASQARQATEFLRAELGRSEREMREHEQQITEFKRAHRGELPSELETNVSRLDRLSDLRQTIQTQLSAAEGRIATLAQMGNENAPNSPQSRLNTLRARLASEQAVYTDDHPNVISTRRQIEALERELQTNPNAGGDDPSAPRLIQAAQREIADLREQLARVESESAQLEQRVAQTPKREEELEAYTQKATVLRETYLSNLRKVEAAELAESVEFAQQGATVRVLDRAVPPTYPNISSLLVIAAGLVGSLAAALAIGVLLELLDPVIVSPEQLESIVGVPVLGSVGVSA